MEQSLVFLKLFLDALNVPVNIGDKDHRKILQKAVYLGQACAKVDLGHRFGWYINGPYAKSLADDYYRLAPLLKAGDKDFENYFLHPEAEGKLNNLWKLFSPPNTNIEQAEWMEVLASIDFIHRVLGKTGDAAEHHFKDEKQNLAEHYNEGLHALEQIELQPA